MEQLAKTGDMTLAQIVQGIESREQGFFAKMNATLGGDVVENIIREQQNLNATRGFRVGLSVIQAAIKQAARVKSAETITALAVGQRDTIQLSAKGKRLPGNVTFLRPGKMGHFEIAVWGKSLKNGLGAPADISLPSMVKISIEKEKYTTKNNDIGESISLLEVIQSKPLNGAELATKLIGAFPPKKFGDISELDLYQVVIVKGKIAGVNPIPVFTKLSEGDEINKAKYEKSGEMPIMMADESPDKLMHPVLQIALAIEQGTAIRVSLDQRKTMHGVYMLEDFQSIVEEAFKAFPNDPATAAGSVGGYLLGRPILVVGQLKGIRGDSAAGIRNVDITASTIVDVPENLPVLANDPGQLTLGSVQPVAVQGPAGEQAPAGKQFPAGEQTGVQVPNGVGTHNVGMSEGDGAHGPNGVQVPKKSASKKTHVPIAAVKSQSEIISAIREEFPRICGVLNIKNITDRPLDDILASTKLHEKYDPLLIEVAYESKRPKEEAVHEEVSEDEAGTEDEVFGL
jgi:hypothetical protein